MSDANQWAIVKKNVPSWSKRKGVTEKPKAAESRQVTGHALDAQTTVRKWNRVGDNSKLDERPGP